MIDKHNSKKTKFLNDNMDLNNDSVNSKLLFDNFFDGYIEEFAGTKQFISAFMSDEMVFDSDKYNYYIKHIKKLVEKGKNDSVELFKLSIST